MIAFHVNYTKFYILYYNSYSTNFYTDSLFSYLSFIWVPLLIKFYKQKSAMCVNYYLLKSMEIVKMLTTVIIFDVKYDKRFPMVTRNFNNKQANCQFSNENQNIHVLKNNQIKSFSNVSQLVYMTKKIVRKKSPQK